jgi:hypothetical protein
VCDLSAAAATCFRTVSRLQVRRCCGEWGGGRVRPAEDVCTPLLKRGWGTPHGGSGGGVHSQHVILARAR